MNLGSGWVERVTSNDSALIYDHESGYVILGVMEDDGTRRWDLARGRGPKSRIISEHPFQSMFEAAQAAEMAITQECRVIPADGRRTLLRAG
jgi:hypothetical protein